jgi:tetratricopeptide (TPR) repeat protein
MKSFGILISILILIITSCASSPVKKDRSQALYGMIYDRDNKPVNDVRIYVDGKYRAASDIHGRFVIPNIKPHREYHITTEKKQYEEIGMDIFHTDPASVLYIHLFSADQLIAEAEQAIPEKDWYRAESFLARAEKAGGDYVSIRYLEGILAFYKDQYPRALSILLELAEKEKNAPYVYLFIADLYQYYINDTAGAIRFLSRFLELQYDQEAEDRLHMLKEY